MDGSLPDLRGQLAALLDGVIPLDRFLDWYFANSDAIEFEGSDVDVELLNGVFNRYAEYTSDYIDASQFIDALREDLLEHDELRRLAPPQPNEFPGTRLQVQPAE